MDVASYAELQLLDVDQALNEMLFKNNLLNRIMLGGTEDPNAAV
jgi:hypothetical protein